ncbi:MAG: DUF1735 and LamG domain-containing protein [Alloprevotella sp.]|nr:DUF1735 and LamG domain-containing protein [Alloprevotella sp.]
MKHIVKLFSAAFAVVALSSVAVSCDDDMETYDNKAFITSEKVHTIVVKGSNNEEDGVIKTAIAQREAQDVVVTYGVDASQVTSYNEQYGEEAVIVPEENYEVDGFTSTILAGALQGNDVTIHFKDLNDLDREVVYVLPVVVKSSTLEVLRSTKTAFFVIRGGALVNSAADITRNYLSLKSPGSATSLGSLNQLTAECLVRVTVFGKLISTIMGREGNFLIRIGDAGVPDNQIQLATSNGNVTDAAWVVPTGEWAHVAVTFDRTNGATDVYINGVHKGATQYSSYRNAVNWNTSDFYVGKSYDDNRWLEGLICEARIWNRVLTAEEIQAKNHFFMADPEDEDLAAYWKFDEGAGREIADHTANGNALQANVVPGWKAVSLPE